MEPCNKSSVADHLALNSEPAVLRNNRKKLHHYIDKADRTLWTWFCEYFFKVTKLEGFQWEIENCRKSQMLTKKLGTIMGFYTLNYHTIHFQGRECHRVQRVFQRGQMSDSRGGVCSLTVTHYFMIHLGKEEIFIFIIQTTENQVQQNISGQLRICIHSGIEKKIIECLVCVRLASGTGGIAGSKQRPFLMEFTFQWRGGFITQYIENRVPGSAKCCEEKQSRAREDRVGPVWREATGPRACRQGGWELAGLCVYGKKFKQQEEHMSRPWGRELEFSMAGWKEWGQFPWGLVALE